MALTIDKPDQFVNQFTGDPQKKVHENYTHNREFNRDRIVSNVYKDYNLSPKKAKMQNQENMDNFYNGHKLLNSARINEQKKLQEALINQMLVKSSNQKIMLQGKNCSE